MADLAVVHHTLGNLIGVELLDGFGWLDDRAVYAAAVYHELQVHGEREVVLFLPLLALVFVSEVEEMLGCHGVIWLLLALPR